MGIILHVSIIIQYITLCRVGIIVFFFFLEVLNVKLFVIEYDFQRMQDFVCKITIYSHTNKQYTMQLIYNYTWFSIYNILIKCKKIQKVTLLVKKLSANRSVKHFQKFKIII